MMSRHDEEFVFEVEAPGETGEQRAKKRVLFDGQVVLRLLRGVGALIIVVSAATFLFKHWTPGSDLQRFLFLLGFTAVLSIGGLFCGLFLKESNGARTLLGLTLAVTPINFAVMAALLYSQFSWDGALAQLPNYATWVASSPIMAVATSVGGLVLLAPLGHFSFMALGRRCAKLLTATFLVANGVLLLPTRAPDVMAFVFFLLVIFLVSVETRYLRGEMSLRTTDGFLARIVLWLPAVIIIGRSGYFYAPSQLFGSVILGALSVFSFVLLPQLVKRGRWSSAFQGCGAVLAGVAWMNAADLLFRFSYVSHRYEILLMLLPLAGLLLLLARFALGGGEHYRRFAGLIAVLAGVLNLVAYPGVVMAFICLLICGAVVVSGYLYEQKLVFVSGILGSIVAVGYQFKAMFHHFSLGGWSGLMVVGVLIIVSASVMERHSHVLKERLAQGRSQFRQWKH